MNYPTVTSSTLRLFLDTEKINNVFKGPPREFLGVGQLDRCLPNQLSWSKTLNRATYTSEASVILVPMSEIDNVQENISRTFVFVDNPRDVFRIILSKMFSTQVASSKGIDQTDLFEKKPEDCYVSRSAIVASGVILGSRVIIHHGVTIYPNVVIGDDTEIGPGSIIGGPGYGHVRLSDGTLNQFPHVGGVQIGNHVTIGNNTCVDSGGLSPTFIGDGCKIGNLTQIAHNVMLGENCLIGTRCQIAGGTKIGSQTEVWAGVTISNNRTIGKNCSIKIGSIVITDLSDGSQVSGNFAEPHKKRMEKYKTSIGKQSE